MVSAIILLLISWVSSNYAQCSNALYGQCGGILFNGDSCCPPGSCCEKSDPHYSQCRPCVKPIVPSLATSSAPIVTKTSLPSSSLSLPPAPNNDMATSSPSIPSFKPSTSTSQLPSLTPISDKGNCGLQWEQCGGGPDYKGPSCCIAGFCCVFNSAYYSQCLACPSPSTNPTNSIPTAGFTKIPVSTPPVIAAVSSTVPTSAFTSQPTVATTVTPTISKTSSPSLGQSRTNCVQENFDTINFQYFDAVSCPGGMSILSGGYLNLHVTQDCSASRLDSKVFYQNAYVETRFKIGGQGPDFSGLVYAFYTDGIVKPNNKHADEIDVEIVGYGNPGRGWAPKTAQLGFWEPGYDLFQHFIQDGPLNLDEFNTYAVQWNYGTVDFFINGVKRFSSSQFDTSIGYVQPQKVIYSLWDGTPYPDFSAAMNWNSPRAKDYNMVIDYVKICT